MISDQHKRAVSAIVFGLGILGGLWGCVECAGASFTIGANDSTREILAIIFALGTPLPVCIFALWKRLVPGIWLIFAGFFFIYGTLAQRTYMIDVRHFPDQPTIVQTVRFAIPYTLTLAAFGAFALVTHLLKWPEVLRRSGNQ